MLRSLVSLALRQRVVVVFAAAALVVLGVMLAMRSPLDVFPEFAPPLVEVQTEAPGMSSEAVEKLVTFELESALSGVPHMTMMRSKSVPGLSSVQMFFAHGSDQTQIRQMIDQRLRVAADERPHVVGIGFQRELRRLRLLQAQDVRLLLLEQPADEPDAQPDRVDVPGDQTQRTAPTIQVANLHKNGARSGGMTGRLLVRSAWGNPDP